MSDESLRRREHDAPRDPQAAAAWLTERLRAGRLSRERLALAAYLGHVPARLALGAAAPPVPADEAQLLLGLRSFGRDACARAAVTLARRALARWEAERPDDVRPRQAIERAEAWLASPGEEAARAAATAAEAAFDAGAEVDRDAAALGNAANAAGWAAECALGDLERALRSLASGAGGRAAVERELVAWALGAPTAC